MHLLENILGMVMQIGEGLLSALAVIFATAVVVGFGLVLLGTVIALTGPR